MSVDLEHIRQVYEEAECLFTEQQLQAAIERMAAAITEQLGDKNPLVYCVLNGGLVTTGQLLPKLNFPLEASYMHATRYRNSTTGGTLDWKVPPKEDMTGRYILIVDDILDEGHTLDAVINHCKEQGAASVQTAVLLNKIHNRRSRPDLVGDYVGLDVEDRYIFGYGLDYQGYWRNAAGIFALKDN